MAASCHLSLLLALLFGTVQGALAVLANSGIFRTIPAASASTCGARSPGYTNNPVNGARCFRVQFFP